jgi:hypothetical protein
VLASIDVNRSDLLIPSDHSQNKIFLSPIERGQHQNDQQKTRHGATGWIMPADKQLQSAYFSMFGVRI